MMFQHKIHTETNMTPFTTGGEGSGKGGHNDPSEL